MNTLTVWRFSSPAAAEGALPRLLTADVDVDDAALVAWPPTRRTPVTRELGSLTGPGELWHGFWGMLFGLVFLTPLAGPAFGAAAGAVAGSLADFGVADDFVKRIRDGVTPGSSALFAFSSRTSANHLAMLLGDLAVEVVRTELSLEQEQHLRDALADR